MLWGYVSYVSVSEIFEGFSDLHKVTQPVNYLAMIHIQSRVQLDTSYYFSVILVSSWM